MDRQQVARLIGDAVQPPLRLEVEQNLDTLQLLLTTRREPVTFFVGAGISAPSPSNLPLATRLISSVVKELRTLSTATGRPGSPVTAGWASIDAAVARHDILLESLISIIRDAVGPAAIDLTSVYRLSLPERHFNKSHDFLATWLRQDRGSVVTTNFDELVEAAYANQVGAPIGSRALYLPAHFASMGQMTSRLLKLHGTASVPESIQVTFDHIGSRLPGEKAEALAVLIASSHGCIVGWEAADIDIRPVIIDAIRQATRDGHHWYFVVRPGSNRRTLEDYLQEKPTLGELLASGVKLIVGESQCLFGMLSLEVFGFNVRSGSEPHADETDALTRSAILGLSAHRSELPWLVVGNLLHQLGELDQAEAVFSDAIPRAEASLRNLFLEASHAAFDANHGVRALRYLEAANRLAVGRRGSEPSLQNSFGTVSQLLSPNWIRELRSDPCPSSFLFAARQWIRFPVMRRNLVGALKLRRGSPSEEIVRDAEMQLAELATIEVSTVIRLVDPWLCSPLLRPLRWSLRRKLTSSLDICQHWNFLPGQYSALRRRALLWHCDDCEKAQSDLREVARICNAMHWTEAMRRVAVLSARITRRCGQSAS